MNVKQLQKEMRKKRPKTYAKLDKRWDFKMMRPVMDFVFSIIDDVNPRLKKLAKKDEYLIRGEDIEAKVWKLLTKARRMK